MAYFGRNRGGTFHFALFGIRQFGLQSRGDVLDDRLDAGI